jgi:hypothetical protein
MKRRALAAAAVAALAVPLAACSGTGAPAPAGAVTTPAIPPTAAAVASQIGATGCHEVRNHGSGPYWVTGCTATWHGGKVGISTFSSRKGRDAWLVTSREFGVVPELESDVWVVYPSMRG